MKVMSAKLESPGLPGGSVSFPVPARSATWIVFASKSVFFRLSLTPFANTTWVMSRSSTWVRLATLPAAPKSE